MPYTLRKTNGTTLAIIQDGAIETSTDLTFVGKNYAGYGQTVNENFLKLLENFASSRAPEKPLIGQTYFDTTVLKLKVYDGSRFKSLTITDVDNKRPSDLRLGDQWFDPVDQKLYVYNGQDFVMIGPEKAAAALQSQIAGILVQDDTFSSYTVLQASVGSGVGSMTAIFSPNAFTPNTNSAIVTDQKFANIARGITLPGTSATLGTKDTNVVGALPDKANRWTFFGASGSSWGLLEYDGLGNIIFYDSKNYIRRDEFAAFSGSLTINNNDGLTIGLNSVIRLNVDPAIGNNQGNLTNLQTASININGRINNTLTNMIAFDYSNSTISIIPNKKLGNNPGTPDGIPTDLGTETNRFRAGYIKTIYTNYISTTTTGVIQGTWTLASGSSIIGGSVQATSAVTATNAVNLQSDDNTTYVHAKRDETGFSIAQRQGNGTLTINGVNSGSTGTSKFYGNWEVAPTSTVQATTLLGSGNVGYLSANIAAANNTIVQRTDQGYINASGLTTPKLLAGSLESSNGTITGQWTLVGSSTLQATYADIAERYEADAEYEPGTVLIIGGAKEVTTTNVRANASVAGIVSTKPAFKMNYDAGPDSTHPFIALKGRVPCKVKGPIYKGNKLVTSSLVGYAEAFQPGDDPSAVIGMALQDWFGEPALIEVMVK